METLFREGGRGPGTFGYVLPSAGGNKDLPLCGKQISSVNTGDQSGRSTVGRIQRSRFSAGHLWPGIIFSGLRAEEDLAMVPPSRLYGPPGCVARPGPAPRPTPGRRAGDPSPPADDHTQAGLTCTASRPIVSLTSSDPCSIFHFQFHFLCGDLARNNS